MISEDVRLIIDVDGVEVGEGLVRSMGDEVDRLQKLFKSAGTESTRFGRRIASALGKAEAQVKSGADRIALAASRATIPEGAATQAEANAARVGEAMDREAQEAEESAERVSRALAERVERGNVAVREIEESYARIQRAATEASNAPQPAVPGGAGRGGPSPVPAGLGDGLEDLEAKQRALNETQKRGTLLLIDYGRLLQDLVYGVRAAVNNVDPLILNTERFNKAADVAAGGTATFTTRMKTLFGVLRSPAGLLLLVNTLFVIGSLTNVFDPLVDAGKQMLAIFKGAGEEAKKMREEIQEGITEAAGLRDALDVSGALASYDELSEKLDALQDERRVEFWKRLGRAASTVLAPVGGGLARPLFDTDKTKEDNDRLEEEIGRLETLSQAYGEAVTGFRIEEGVLALGDANVVTQRAREIEEQIRDAGIRVLELRRVQGEINIELESEIIRLQTEAQQEELAVQRQKLLAFYGELGPLTARLIRAVGEGATAELRTQAASSLAVVESASETLLRRIRSIDDEQQALESEAEQRIAELQARLASAGAKGGREGERRRREALELLREVQDAELAAERALLDASLTRAIRFDAEAGLAERLALAETETEQQRIQLERQLEDFQGNESLKARLRAATNDQLAALEDQLAERLDAIRRDEASRARERSEALLRAREDAAEAIGIESETDVVRARIRRAEEAQAALEAIGDRESDEYRELTTELISLGARLTVAEERAAQERERLREREAAALESHANRLRTFAEERLRLVSRIAESTDGLGRLVNVNPFSLGREEEAERAILAARLARYRQELAAAEQTETGVIEARERMLDAEIAFAANEQRIYDERLAVISSFYERAIFLALDFARQERRITALDEEAFRYAQRQRSEQLDEELRRRRISSYEYNLEQRLLAQDTTDFEKRLAEDRKSVLLRIGEEITNALIEEGVRRVAAFIAQETAKLIFGVANAQTIAATTSAAMTQIAVSAGAAAGAVSIATFGAAAATGTAAAISGILATQAATVAASRIPAFASGGEVRGPGSGTSDSILARLSSGEFVLTAKAVRGKYGLFGSLMAALEAGRVSPDDLALLLGLRSSGPAGSNLLLNIGYSPSAIPGYASGGPVIMPSNLLPEPGELVLSVPGLDDVAGAMKALMGLIEQQRRDSATIADSVQSLASEVVHMKQNPPSPIIGDAASRAVVERGNLAARRAGSTVPQRTRVQRRV